MPTAKSEAPFGVVEPIESTPRMLDVAIMESVVEPTTIWSKREVDEAKTPFCAQMGEVVAAERAPKLVVKVNESVPPPEPQALPVLEIVPLVEKVAQPAVPPALETMRFVVEAVPEIVSAVVDAYGNVEAEEDVEVTAPPTKRPEEM